MNYENDLHTHTDMNNQNELPSFLKSVTITPLTTSVTLRSVGEKFQPETAIVCPCCHQMSMEKAFFPPLLKNREGIWQYHCMDENCAGFHRTLSLEQFIADYGKDKQS